MGKNNSAEQSTEQNSIAEKSSPHYTCFSDFLRGEDSFLNEDDIASLTVAIGAEYGEYPDADDGNVTEYVRNADEDWCYPDLDRVEFETSFPTSKKGGDK